MGALVSLHSMHGVDEKGCRAGSDDDADVTYASLTLIAYEKTKACQRQHQPYRGSRTTVKSSDVLSSHSAMTSLSCQKV